ncbi:hypothetical protein OHC33_005742 [Knufia fluminis]|uniref:Glyoxalase-like domain-containing protein n=1 Tax=Knufia fluminis TaxID=191047 RepID=A0AAN8EDM3_9EURO|nr:hypothetical protein OHC33_005742 [Knufia fluminis]
MSTQLDHVILLLSPADFDNVPAWLSNNFTIIDGGKHSKGTSQNKLIIFQDGTYIELFSWVDPQPDGVEPYADFPSWASKPEGHIIDWALTGSDAHGKYDEIMAQLRDLEANGEQLGITYDQPKEGGRRRMDGKELRWYATRPRQVDTEHESVRVDVPFFCHDISDRTLRVPYTQGSTDDWPRITTHPCGATGVFSLAVRVPPSKMDSCVKLYEGILGTRGDSRNVVAPSMASFTIDTPAQSADVSGRSLCVIFLIGKGDAAGETGTSVEDLMLLTSKHERKGDRLNDDGFGAKITLC